MAESGDRFIQSMRMRLAEIVDAETASTILDVMCYELKDYELTKKSTEIVPYEGDNVKVIKSYMACIIVEGKAKSTAKQYCYHIKKMYLRKYLEQNKHKSEYVFTNHFGEQYTPSGVRHKTTDLAERCKIHIHLHRFRRTLATDLAEKGMPIQEIQKLLGHTSIETTRKYIEVRKKKIEASYRQFVA